MKKLAGLAFALSFLSLPLLATDYYLIKNETAMADYSSFDGRGSNNGGFSGWATTATGTTKVQYNNSYGAVDPDGDYYLNNKIIRAKPNETATGYTFQGRTLIFDGSSSAINSKITVNKVMTIGRLLVPSGGFGEFRQGDKGTKYLAGTNWVVESGATLSFNTSENKDTSNVRNWSCSATITGQGTLLTSAGIYDEARGVKETASPAGGTITYTGDLTGFAGYLNAGGFGQTHYSGWTLSHITANLTTTIADTKAFPQATPDGNLLERSIIVADGAKLSFTCDVTSPAIRGWDFGDGEVPTVDVASGKTVTILGPVKGSAGLNKTGAGKLILNVGGKGEYDTITLEDAQTVTAERLAQYVEKCDEYISGSVDTIVGLSLSVNGGTSATLTSAISFLSLKEGESATLKILYGTAADALNGTATATSPVTADGSVPVTVKGLMRGTAYYFKAVLELPGDKTAESDVLSATTITDYTTAMRRIEYIEGNGTQYIDSWYYPSPDTHVKADFQFTTLTKQHRVFGLSVGGVYFHAYINDKGNFGYCLADGATWKAVGDPQTPVTTDRYLFDFNYIDGNDNHAYTIYTNGAVAATQSPMEGSITQTSTVPLAIAATRSGTTGGVTDGHTSTGHRIYSFAFDEGGALTAALAPVVRASDSAVGLYDSVRNIFMPSESAASYVAGPTIATAERFTGASQTAVDLTFLGAPMARDLRIAYGPGFGGDNPADWGATALVATVPAGATSYSVPLPANWGSEDACVLRCYFDDGTTFPLWSDAVVYREATDPIITGVTVDGAGGDTLVVRGNLVFFPGEDDCTLSVRVTKGTGTPVVWSDLVGSKRSTTGEFELTLREADTTAARYIEPGATFTVVVEGTAGGATGGSSAVSVTTAGAPEFASSGSAVNRRTVTFTGDLSDLGANGSATVTLYVGETQNALVAVETPVVRTTPGSFSIVHTFDDFEKTYYWQLGAVCTTAGERDLETRTEMATIKTLDTTTYTWQAVDGEWNGDWSDPAHWANDKNGDCLGYPQSSSATASFLNCTLANPVTVNVDGKYPIKGLRLFDADAADISFVGSGTAASSLNVSDEIFFRGTNGYMPTDSHILFKDMTLNASGNQINFANSEVNTETGLSVVFSGAAVNTKTIWLRANESSLAFRDGTTVTIAEKFSFGGTNTVITIDNSTVTTPNLYAGDNRDSTGLKLRFEGAAPRLNVSNQFQTYNRADKITIEFAVPVDGYSAAPLNKTGAALATKLDKIPGTFTFSVAEDSPALVRSNELLANQVLVQTAQGFAMDYIDEDIGTVPEHSGESCGAFKWGVNGAALAEGAELTTARQLLLDLQGYGRKTGIMFLVY